MWLYRGNTFEESMIEGYKGFVYIITNHDKNMYYIGKKGFTKVKTYQKNKRKRRMLVESDWEEYTGSNEQLNEDVANGDNITKEILHLCKTKSEMSYLEAKEQFERDVLKDDKSYNQWIMVKIRKAHLK